jgi:hypothetical protein
MQGRSREEDEAAIRSIIAVQFQCMDWEPGRPADWTRFGSLFFPDTTLIPAARPAKRQTIDAFMERMKRLEANGSVRSFRERMLGSNIHIYGNVAVAVAACEMIENGQQITRDVSCILFIRDGGEWKIAAQAWDLETPTQPIPPELSTPNFS